MHEENLLHIWCYRAHGGVDKQPSLVVPVLATEGSPGGRADTALASGRRALSMALLGTCLSGFMPLFLGHPSEQSCVRGVPEQRHS